MTSETTLKVRSFLWQRLGIWAIGGLLWGVSLILAAVFTPLGTRVMDIWTSPERLGRIEAKLDVMIVDVRRATGEDRVIRQTPGMSYVTEPVTVGDIITMNIVAERTSIGRDCQLINSQSLFTDGTNVTTPGRRAVEGAPLRQIDDTPTRIRVELIPPQNLQPGRVELYLALEYRCGERTIFDRTDAVTFELLPRRAGD
ncbi:hypothetical protein [Loktanella salsilacus]|uniref:hypothetical protein n=1 Tax=Loktanella salsilacus TaxID=195913 RepID=UPI0037037205